ncbi:MAG: FtsX-like permease family protein [Luteitalea sp.]|nr:FtsX-like permease family protein [Luteitalea sp.]
MATRLHHRVRMALRSFLRRPAAERELDEELQFHFQEMEARKATRGSARAKAHSQARRRFGGSDQVKEACRDMRTLRPVEDCLQDLRFGVRLLTRSPLFSIVAVLSLALGIGANAAIFSLINAIILRPLPVTEPEQLYIARVTHPDPLAPPSTALIFSNPVFEDARDLVAGPAEMAAATTIRQMQIATSDSRRATSQLESGQVQLVSGEYFHVLRQRPQIGRLLGPGDNRTLGSHPVAVISDSYFRRKFGRSPDVLGRSLIINDAPFTIVGVTAPEFFGTELATHTPHVWVPLMMQASVRYAGNRLSRGDVRNPWPPQREIQWLNIFVRVPSGDVAAVAEAMTLALQRGYRLRNDYNEDAELQRRYQANRVALTPGSRGLSPMRDDLSTPLLALFGMVGLLLAIACANIASLLLARATNRYREMAIRLSIGAARGRLMRQLLTECLLLALIGGGLGLLVSSWGSRALLTLANYGTAATSGGLDLSPDWRVAGFTLGVAVLTGLLFGMLPALRSARVSLAETLKSQARSVISARGRGRLPAAKALIAGQLAFALLLLIVAALFTRSLQQLIRVDIGFDRDHVLIARVDARAAGYTPAELPPLYRRVVERVTAVPGVTAASVSRNGPFGGGYVTSGFEAEGYTRGRHEWLVTGEDYITPGYFRTVGLAMKMGRTFGPHDSARGRKVSIINETMARRYFSNRNPIGSRWGYGTNFDEDGFEIIGVVQDARYDGLKSDSPSMAYLPAAQRPDDYLASLEMRTAGNPAALASTIRNALREAEPSLPVTSLETLDERVARGMRQEQLLAWLTIGFSAVALFLACLWHHLIRSNAADGGARRAHGAGREPGCGAVAHHARGAHTRADGIDRRPTARVPCDAHDGDAVLWHHTGRSCGAQRRRGHARRHRGARSVSAGTPRLAY